MKSLKTLAVAVLVAVAALMVLSPAEAWWGGGWGGPWGGWGGGPWGGWGGGPWGGWGGGWGGPWGGWWW
jgi:hypothetical protein